MAIDEEGQLKKIQDGLFFSVGVADQTDVNNCILFELTGKGDGFFIGYWIWVLWDGGGAGAAPQGEARMITDYVSVTGVFTHAAFSAALAAGDKVLIINPTQYASMTIPGGAGTLQDIIDTQAALLDLAEYPIYELLMDGAEQTLYEAIDQDVPFLFGGIKIDWTGLNFGGGEDTTIRYYEKIDGTNYVLMYTEVFLNAALPVPPGTAHPITPASQKPTPDIAYCQQDIKITAEQAGVGGGWNTLSYRVIDAIRGG